MLRKWLAMFLGATLGVAPVAEARPRSQDADTVKARVRELHAKASEVRIKLVSGARIQGQILRVEVDSFTVRQKKTAQEVAVPYAQVVEVKKKGLSRGTKAAVIPAIVGGGVLLFFCAAPYPIGFLCRKDPS